MYCHTIFPFTIFVVNFFYLCTLFQVVFTHPGYHLAHRMISYYLVFFPSLDVLSTFPIMAHIQVNSIYHIITGHDTSEKPKYKYDWLLRLLLRFTAAILPIAAALGLSNLAYVLKGGGFLGLACYQAAFLLQVRSIYVSKRVFGRPGSANSNLVRSRNGGTGSSALLKSKQCLKNGEVEASTSYKATKWEANDKHLYMTPYSFTFFSQPLVSWTMVVLGFILYVLAFVDFFFKPEKLSCVAETVLQNATITLE